MALECRDDAREVLGRVGLAERAAERAAVADDRVGEDVLGFVEDREEALEQMASRMWR